MRNNIKLFIWLSIITLFLSLPCSLRQPQAGSLVDLLYFPNPEIKISMDFKDANLRDILKIFSKQAGLNFLATEEIEERRLTLYLDNVPVRDAMDKIFKANNLTYELEPESNIFIVKQVNRSS